MNGGRQDRDMLARLSARGINGGSIVTHRAINRLSLPASRIAAVLLLPPLLNLLTASLWDDFTGAWQSFFSFWLERLELHGFVSFYRFGPADLAFTLPHVELPTVSPHAWEWWSAALLCVGAFALSSLVPERFTPLRYFIRACAVIQASAVAYFAVFPKVFPYTLPAYLDATVESAVWFMLLVPWVHALIYYIFGFSLLKKLALTLLTLGFVAIAVPFQVMVHADLLVHGSVILMPLLYLILGPWCLLFSCMALYGWAMSWKRIDLQ